MLRELCENLDVNADGHLTFAGVDTVELAKKYQTPLYVMDEDRIRRNCLHRSHRILRQSCFHRSHRSLHRSQCP